MRFDVVVIGAGAAGLLAACRAAERGRRVLLLEKNRRPGVKILMSGGTRCNLTHACDARGILRAFGKQGRFLHSALAALGPADLVKLIEAEGVPTKVEETGKVFPASDKAGDVLEALLRRLRRTACALALDEPALDLRRAPQGFEIATPRGAREAAAVIVTTGGKSYPKCGTCGDGYPWAAALGHHVTPLRPALTPLVSPAAWVKELQGVTLVDAELSVRPRAEPKNILESRRASLLFTHFGLSGPAALDVSRAVSGHPCPAELELACDFVPALRADELEQELQRARDLAGKRQLASVLAAWLPQRLAETLPRLAGAAPEARAAELSKTHRRQLVEWLKRGVIPLEGARGYQKAEVTAGGVRLDEVDSRNMQSKLVPGLFFAGEILDLDGPIGGFNFQAAFSTGWLAGSHA